VCNRELVEFNLTGVCDACWQALEPWAGPACTGCGLPFSSDRALEATAGLCAQCRTGELAIDRARSFNLYRDGLRALILQLKFRRRERLGVRLGALLASLWDSLIEGTETVGLIIVPVPLHAVRQRERGYNQAALLAEGLSRHLARVRGVTGVDTRALLRTRPTPPQTGLSVAARRENVRGVFSVAEPDRVRGHGVVLVDDVMTTGSTLSSCASALKAAGAQRVLAITLARSTPEFPDLDAQTWASSVDDFDRARS
jgi:ComF family protein